MTNQTATVVHQSSGSLQACWISGAAGVVAGVLAGALIALVIMRIRRRRGPVRPAAVIPAPVLEHAPESGTTQRIEEISSSSISAGTRAELRKGLEIHELNREQLQEILDEAYSVSLDRIDDDVVREKLIRCVMGSGITKFLPAQAEALWGCVLSWDPSEAELEKQSTDILSWACDDAGEFDDAKPIAEHSRHDIPVPDKLPVSDGLTLVFERKLNTLLDEGASASVFRAHAVGYRDLAVKISRLTEYGILRNTLREYLMLRRAQGLEAMIRLYGAGCYHVKGEVYFFIVEELAETTLAGDYESRKAAKNPFTEKELRERIVKPVLSSLVRLHERGIIHRDLKPKNIYLVDGVFKMGDFEIAAYSREESREVNSGTFAGTPAYTTAAALVGRYGPDTDINALACICFMLLRGDLPGIEDAPGTSTLVRGIQGGAAMSDDDRLRQEKAKKAVQEWLVQKRGFVSQIRKSLRSTPFERFFIAPIMAQGLYPEVTAGAIVTAAEALHVLSRIELSEEAQEMRKTALSLAAGGNFELARRTLTEFDARFHGRSNEDIEVSMHVMLGDVLKDIDQLESGS